VFTGLLETDMENVFSELKGKTVLVTGSGRGIGKSIAEHFAAVGANIVITDIDEATAATTATEIADRYKVQTLSVVSDVSDEASVDALFAKISETFATLDVLVNNAGITMDGLFIRMKTEQWKKVIDINLTGTYLCSQRASNIMRKQRSGVMINISSIVAMGNPGQANYSASKAGLLGLTRTLAKELAPMGIRVNAVTPGFIHTPMTDKIPEKRREEMVSHIPLGRMGKPEDIAKAILFLATNSLSGYITGAVLEISGGLTGL